MNGKYFVGKKVSSFEAYHPEDPITGVRLTVDQSNAYFAGDMDGNVWEMHCPYGTQQMADNILASLRGQVYKGFEAQDAVLSPEAELGDGITVNGLYTSLGYRKVEFGPGHFSTVSAPGTNEPDEEYKYIGQKDRDEQYSRADTYSYIEKTSEEIKLGVRNDMDKQSAEFTVQLGKIEASLRDEINDLSADMTLKYDEFSVSLKNGLDGLSADFQVKLDGLSASFEDSQKQQTANFEAGLSGLKYDLEDQLSKQSVSFEADLKGIRTRVTDAEGNISSLEQTAKSLRSDLTSAEGDISSLEQTAKSLRSDITSAQGDISSVEQYAKSIRLSVTDGSSSSTLTLTAGQSTLSSASIQFQGVVDFINDGTTRINGSAIKTGTITATQIKSGTITSKEIMAGTITFENLNGNGDLGTGLQGVIQQNAVDAKLATYTASAAQQAAEIAQSAAQAANTAAVNAQTTATSANNRVQGWTYTGTTMINGAMIVSDTIMASKLIGGTVFMYDANSNLVGGISITRTYGIDAFGLELYSNTGGIRMSPSGYFWVNSAGGNFGTTMAGFQITADCLPTNPSRWYLGSGGNTWKAVYADSGSILSSDERYKNSIESVPDKYITMLDKVEPVIYRLNSGESGRLHAGFVSQQVKEAMDEAGVDSTEFGGFVIAKDGEGNDFYMLRYEEFIAPMLAKMRQLEQRIKVLEGT